MCIRDRIFDEPTVGVDVGAKEEIYKLMEKLTEQGRSIILISSYLPEVMGLADRLIVMAQGRITGEFNTLPDRFRKVSPTRRYIAARTVLLKTAIQYLDRAYI